MLIRDTFGTNVASIVEHCSDTFETPKPDWQIRKETYIKALPKHSDSVRLVSAADKLDNIRDILAGYSQEGKVFWQKFSGSRDQIVWYYKSLCDIYLKQGPKNIGAEIQACLTALEQRIALGNP